MSIQNCLTDKVRTGFPMFYRTSRKENWLTGYQIIVFNNRHIITLFYQPLLLQCSVHEWEYKLSHRILSIISIAMSKFPDNSPDSLQNVHFSRRPRDASSSSTSRCQKHKATTFGDNSPGKMPRKIWHHWENT